MRRYSKTRHALSALLLGALCWIGSGCIFISPPPPPSCSPQELCSVVEQAVCGQDGFTYTCAAQAQCLGVTVDPTQAACRNGCPILFDCPLFCVTYKKDANDCDTCACAAPVCTKLSCAGNIPPSCDGMDDRGCPICSCP